MIIEDLRDLAWNSGIMEYWNDGVHGHIVPLYRLEDRPPAADLRLKAENPLPCASGPSSLKINSVFLERSAPWATMILLRFDGHYSENPSFHVHGPTSPGRLRSRTKVFSGKSGNSGPFCLDRVFFFIYVCDKCYKLPLWICFPLGLLWSLSLLPKR